MVANVYIVCATCRRALVLEWDATAFLTADPLGGQVVEDWQVVEGAVLFGCWPELHDAPAPLAAGAWSALATRAVPFYRRHVAHPDAAGIFMTTRQPDRATPVQVEPFSDPAPPPAAPPGAAIPGNVSNLTLDQRLELAARLGAAGLRRAIDDAGGNAADGLLLAGWLPGDPLDDDHLLGLVLDTDRGPAAEAALTTRIVLGTADPALRRRRLLEVAETAYARRALGWGRVRPTPYDGVAPLALLQAGAVRRLAAAGHLEQACELAEHSSLTVDRLGPLREALGGRILDRGVPADARLRFVRHAGQIFPGLLGELRRERGLAVEPLPSPHEWPKLVDQSRSMAVLTVAPDAVRSSLASPEVSEVMVALDVVRTLAGIDPAEASPFEALVRALCRDGRLEPTPVQTRLCARARDVHASLFAELHGAGAWEALVEVIESMLAAGLGVSLGQHFLALAANGIPAERVGALLVGRVADRSRPWKERIQAREALSPLAAEGGGSYPNKRLPSPAGQAAARQADDLLLAALGDPSEPQELKAAVRAAITRWMPDRLPALRGKVIEHLSIPSITDLKWGPETLAGTDRGEVIALLSTPEADPGRLLSALTLAEWLTTTAPRHAPEFEPLLRARIADGRRFVDRARNVVVGAEARRVHQAVWQRLEPKARPAPADLLASLRSIAASQGEPGPGEESRAAGLAGTVFAGLSPADEAAIAAGLEPVIADRGSRAWTRLHAYHAMARLRDQGARADAALFAALADPGEDPVLRAEAHALLAPRRRQEVFALQDRGLLPRPPVPPVATLYHNLPLFERDTEGEWLLTPEAIRLASLLHPDDLVAALRDPAGAPARACAAAALAPLVAQRLPAQAAKLADAMRGAQGAVVGEVQAVVAGRPLSFSLARLCAEGLRGIRPPS